METKKRIYVGLLTASLLFIFVVVLTLWYLITHRDIIINQIVLIAVAVIFGIILIVMGIGILAMVIMIVKSKSIPSMENLTLWANDLLFPVSIFIGKLIGIEKEKILKSFIAVNNYIVKSRKSIPREKVLMLLPHCLQNTDCPHKITIDINNCKKCGKCPVGQLRDLCDHYHAVLRVATGGTLARKWILEENPSAVIAIACERDLASGIQDTGGHLPVLGVLNIRPNGPCVNTDVSLDQVNQALKTICKGGY